MSATEQLLEQVKTLDESDAKATLSWLADYRAAKPAAVSEADLRRMDEALGFARRYRKEARTTDEWMKELREGEAA